MKTKTIIKAEWIGIAVLIIYSLILLAGMCSCASIKEAFKVQDTTVPVKVDKIKYARNYYYAYECTGIYNGKKYYLTGFKNERNISDTTFVRIYPDGMQVFVKTNQN